MTCIIKQKYKTFIEFGNYLMLKPLVLYTKVMQTHAYKMFELATK